MFKKQVNSKSTQYIRKCFLGNPSYNEIPFFPGGILKKRCNAATTCPPEMQQDHTSLSSPTSAKINQLQ